MRIGGHGLRDFIRLLAPLFGLIAAVWALRMVLDVAGAPAVLLHVISVTVAGAISVLFAALLIHNRQFGGYATVVVAVFLLILWQQLLIAGAIAFSTLTGIRNIYSATEFSYQFTLRQHLAAHLTFSLGFGTLIGSAMGCFLLLMLRKLVPLASPKLGR
jgi:hypothetical protein